MLDSSSTLEPDFYHLLNQLIQTTGVYQYQMNQLVSGSARLRQAIQSVKSLKEDMFKQRAARIDMQHQWKRLNDHPSRAEVLTAIDLSIQNVMEGMNVDIQFGSELLKRIMGIIENNIMFFVKEVDDVKNKHSVLLLDLDILTERVNELEKKKQQILGQSPSSLPTSQKLKMLETTSAQLLKQRQKNIELQRTIKQLSQRNQRKNQPSNQRIQSLGNELLASKKKVQEMMKMVTTYQSKTIDLQLENEGLVFQLNTYKANLQELRSPKLKRNMTESIHSDRLENSFKFNTNRVTEPVQKKESIIRQVQEIDLPVLESSMSNKSKQRIFNKDSKRT